MLSKFEIIMTSPTTWDIIMDGKKLDGVRALTLDLEVGCVPTLRLDMFAGEGEARGKAKVGGLR